jgi:drug/metabolite transporter superfamily protein YnfA
MSPSSLPLRGRTSGARALAAVVVTLGVGGVAGGTVAWLLRLLARATGGGPDAGTTEMFLTTMSFLVALLPGALATALERRRGGRVLLAAGGVAVAGFLVARLAPDRLAAASVPAIGVVVVLGAALTGVVTGAVLATAWLTRSAVGPGGSGLAGPPHASRDGREPTRGGGGCP